MKKLLLVMPFCALLTQCNASYKNQNSKIIIKAVPIKNNSSCELLTFYDQSIHDKPASKVDTFIKNQIKACTYLYDSYLKKHPRNFSSNMLFYASKPRCEKDVYAEMINYWTAIYNAKNRDDIILFSNQTESTFKAYKIVAQQALKNLES